MKFSTVLIPCFLLIISCSSNKDKSYYINTINESINFKISENDFLVGQHQSNIAIGDYNESFELIFDKKKYMKIIQHIKKLDNFQIINDTTYVLHFKKNDYEKNNLIFITNQNKLRYSEIDF